MILAAAAACYANCFPGPFVLDDVESIQQNATLRHLGDVRAVLTPLRGRGLTVDGRPFLNLSFAINYAISGTSVWSYHALNVLIHGLAALTLFGVLRRVLFGRSLGFAFSLSVALIWAVHPLNTESVTYLSQRAESLMGLFYLLTLYGFIRASPDARFLCAMQTFPNREGASHAKSGSPNKVGKGSLTWACVSVAGCFLGMATKEVMVSAPITVLLIDRLFYAGSFLEAWRRRRVYYLALGSSWFLLAALVWHTGSRGGTSGFGSGVSAWQYWETQPAAIVRYLRLGLWPRPLVFDYGTEWVSDLSSLIAPVCLVGALGLFTLIGLLRNRVWGVLGFVFFAVLAPTSVIPGNRQTAAEHRMYLALIPIVILVLGGVEELFRRLRGRSGASEAKVVAVPDSFGPQIGLVLLALAVAVPAGWATFARNFDYSSALRLYGDSVEKMPLNAYAQANYATALLFERQYPAAETHFKEALRLNPQLQEAEDNLGNVCFFLGRFDEAESHYRRAMEINPRFAAPHDNIAETFLRENRVPEARREVEIALKLEPGMADAHDNLGMVLLREGRLSEALAEFERATILDPDDYDARVNFGNALRAASQPARACDQYVNAVRIDPQGGQAYYNWGGALMDLHQNAEAEKKLRLAVQFDPGNASARQNLGNVLLAENRAADAVEQYATAVALAPGRASVHYNYANGLLRVGRRQDAIAELHRALELDPSLAAATRLLSTIGE